MVSAIYTLHIYPYPSPPRRPLASGILDPWSSRRGRGRGIMGGGEDGRAGEEVRAPLLVAGGDRNGEAVASRVPRKNSVNSMRVEFVARLPEKVKRGVDPERPFDIDVSLTKDLIEGEKEYYERQFVTLRSFEEIESLNVPSVVDEALELEEQEQSEFAMKISNYANLALLGLKIYATVQSGSIAIAASTLDSLLDLMAGGILWFTHLSMKNINVYQYLIGKLRVRPVGIVIFAAVMATLEKKTTVYGP